MTNIDPNVDEPVVDLTTDEQQTDFLQEHASLELDGDVLAERIWDEARRRNTMDHPSKQFAVCIGHMEAHSNTSGSAVIMSREADEALPKVERLLDNKLGLVAPVSAFVDTSGIDSEADEYRDSPGDISLGMDVNPLTDKRYTWDDVGRDDSVKSIASYLQQHVALSVPVERIPNEVDTGDAEAVSFSLALDYLDPEKLDWLG